MFETSAIELSASALEFNLRFIRKRLKKDVRLCSVVKGNAYGHGVHEFVQMAMKSGVDYFAVHSADEAYDLKHGQKERSTDLFIMGEVGNDALEWVIKNRVEFAVFDFGRLTSAIAVAKKLKTRARVHIEMETGMQRTGFEMDQVAAVAEILKSDKKHLSFHGLFTHYAGAESLANHFRISRQILNFNEALRMFAEEGLQPKYNHSACSAALLNYPETMGNMVRVGILQYGFWPSKETHIRFCGDEKENPRNKLRRIIRWTSRVMSVKNIRKGEFVGYGTSFLAHKSMRIAVVPVGYSHGYARNLSNVGAVLINGKVAPVTGLVNMNSITVDITNAGRVETGDEVVLIGKQKSKAITVNSFSEQTQLLNYELLTRLPNKIPRIIVD